jgi:hypothetical protein
LPAATDEALGYVNMGKMADAALVWGENVLRTLGPLQEPADAAARPIRDSVQQLRRQVKKLAFGVSQARVGAQFGARQANMLGEPTVKYDELTDEQLKFVRDLQKEADSKVGQQKAAVAKTSERVHPYQAAAAAGGGRLKSECHTCGVAGHWARDMKCKPADIQAKAIRDAAAKMQLQLLPSFPGGGYPAAAGAGVVAGQRFGQLAYPAVAAPFNAAYPGMPGQFYLPSGGQVFANPVGAGPGQPAVAAQGQPAAVDLPQLAYMPGPSNTGN